MPIQPEMAGVDKIVRRFLDEVGEHGAGVCHAETG